METEKYDLEQYETEKYDLEQYETENGNAPFPEWTNNLKDRTAQRKIAIRLRRAEMGNLGNYKSITGVSGIFEMIEHYGCGYRIFYSFIKTKTILLLTGSTKKDQAKTILKAKEYLTNYKRSINND